MAFRTAKYWRENLLLNRWRLNARLGTGAGNNGVEALRFEPRGCSQGDG